MHAITMTHFTFEKVPGGEPDRFVYAILPLPRQDWFFFFEELTFALRATVQLAFMLISPWTLGIEEIGKKTFVSGD